MNLNNLQPAFGAKQAKRRVGRGIGSGLGKTAGRGHKGQKSRAGGFHKTGFEGGQMPLQRRLPKRGFKNYLFKVTFEVVNLDRLQAAFGDQKEITLEDIYDRGLCRFGAPVKILGDGEVTTAMTVEAHRFSSSAIDKIRKAGGEVKELCVEALCDCEACQTVEGTGEPSTSEE